MRQILFRNRGEGSWKMMEIGPIFDSNFELKNYAIRRDCHSEMWSHFCIDFWWHFYGFWARIPRLVKRRRGRVPCTKPHVIFIAIYLILIGHRRQGVPQNLNCLLQNWKTWLYWLMMAWPVNITTRERLKRLKLENLYYWRNVSVFSQSISQIQLGWSGAPCRKEW